MLNLTTQYGFHELFLNCNLQFLNNIIVIITIVHFPQTLVDFG